MPYLKEDLYLFIGNLKLLKNNFCKIFILYSYAGISRSATIVIAFLMQEMNRNFFDAMSHVRRKRPIIFPNPGFQK